MSRPVVGQQVDLIVPSRDPFDACVQEAQHDQLVLTLLDGEPSDAVADGEGTLHFTNRRGLCRLNGRVSTAPEGRYLFAPRGGIKLLQRREHVRVEATVRVTFTPDGERRVEGHTLDVSGGGFVLSAADGLEVGATTHFSLDLGGDHPLEVFGTAVRGTERGGLGVRIDVIAPGERERLIHWIFRRERLARAYARG